MKRKLKRKLNSKVISDLILKVESDLSSSDHEEKIPFFVLNNKDDTLGYCAPWSAVSVSDAVFKLAKSLCVVDDDSPMLKDIDHLQLVLWFFGDIFTGDIDSVNYIVCDLKCLIKEDEDV